MVLVADNGHLLRKLNGRHFNWHLAFAQIFSFGRQLVGDLVEVLAFFAENAGSRIETCVDGSDLSLPLFERIDPADAGRNPFPPDVFVLDVEHAVLNPETDAPRGQ